MREQTAAYSVSRYYPRTLTDTVHFRSVCREHRHEKAPLTRQKYKAGRNKSGDFKRRYEDSRKGPSNAPPLCNDVSGEEKQQTG